MREFELMLQKIRGELGIPVEIRNFMTVEPAEISPNERIVQECKKAYQKVMGEEPHIGCIAGFVDAHFLINDLSIPTVIFGPYSSKGDSSAPYFTTSGSSEEHVDVESVVNATRIYAQMILNILVK